MCMYAKRRYYTLICRRNIPPMLKPYKRGRGGYAHALSRETSYFDDLKYAREHKQTIQRCVNTVGKSNIVEECVFCFS